MKYFNSNKLDDSVAEVLSRMILNICNNVFDVMQEKLAVDKFPLRRGKGRRSRSGG